jgi:hypothetical protein
MRKGIMVILSLLFLTRYVFGQSEDDFDITQNSKGTITIIGYRGTAKQVVIPERIEGIRVTEIGRQAFYRKQLTSITIPNSITVIGEGAFRENPLISIIIPNSVISIGDWAFWGAWDDTHNKPLGTITNVIIGTSVTSIGYRAFENNSLTNLIIPNSVKTIGDQAFADNKLNSVIIPNSITSIGSKAFQSNQLTNVNIPNSIISIGDGAFARNQLTSITIPDSIAQTVYGTRSIFSYNQLANITIPNGVTSVGSFAFNSNKLISVTISSSVTSIEEGAFMGNQLTNVTIPNSVSSIGDGAFALSIVDTERHYNMGSGEITYIYTYTGNQPLTSITLPANFRYVNIFPNNFSSFYESQGKKAGTYTWSGRIWAIK